MRIGAYKVWLAGLGVVMAAGFCSYLRQLDSGLGITGLSRDVTWGLYIAQFTFLVGVAASAVMVVLPYYLHDCKSFARITVLGEFLAIAAVVMCMLFILVDLGQPTRVLNVLLYPSPRSVMFWDVLVLSGYLVLNILIAFVSLRAEREEVRTPGWLRPVILLSIPWAVGIHTVTAFLYNGLAARPLWLTALMAPRFLASAFASGPALLILLCMIWLSIDDPKMLSVQKVDLSLFLYLSLYERQGTAEVGPERGWARVPGFGAVRLVEDAQGGHVVWRTALKPGDAGWRYGIGDAKSELVADAYWPAAGGFLGPSPAWFAISPVHSYAGPYVVRRSRVTVAKSDEGIAAVRQPSPYPLVFTAKRLIAAFPRQLKIPNVQMAP